MSLYNLSRTLLAKGKRQKPSYSIKILLQSYLLWSYLTKMIKHVVQPFTRQSTNICLIWLFLIQQRSTRKGTSVLGTFSRTANLTPPSTAEHQTLDKSNLIPATKTRLGQRVDQITYSSLYTRRTLRPLQLSALFQTHYAST